MEKSKKRYEISSAATGGITALEPGICYDGICSNMGCEWETVRVFDDKQEAEAMFAKRFSESEYYENYQQIIEYRLEEYDIICNDGEEELMNINTIRTSHLPEVPFPRITYSIKTYESNATVSISAENYRYCDDYTWMHFNFSEHDLKLYEKDDREYYLDGIRDEILEKTYKAFPDVDEIDTDSLDRVIDTIDIYVDWYFD